MFGSWRKHYSPLQDEKSEDESLPRVIHCEDSIYNRLSWLGLLFILGISLLLNVFAFWLHQQQVKQPDICLSRFAQLPRDTPKPFYTETTVNTLPDEDWEWPVPELGMLALSNEYTEELNLPHAQPWPWDFSKGIYLLHGHHNIHCLKMIRQSISEFRKGSLQSQHYLHIDHCLTALREDIICNADDTPRYTGGNHKQAGSGQDQIRMCRDWNKLDEWANNHSACFDLPRNTLERTHSSEQYKHCPDGREPWKLENR